MQHTKAHLIIFLFSIVVVSCTEKIDIELDESYTRLVVDGAITTDKKAHCFIVKKIH